MQATSTPPPLDRSGGPKVESKESECAKSVVL